jgi:hypothetical protein
VLNYERCTSLSVNVLVTLATQQHLECHCKAHFEAVYIIQHAKHIRYVTLALRHNTLSRMMMTSVQHVAPERKDKRVVAPWR